MKDERVRIKLDRAECKPDLAPSPASVSSTSDDRTVNNAMRHKYRVLSDDEKQDMQHLKDIGLELHNFIDGLSQEKPEPRELMIAKEKVEEAVMWATKFITK